MVLSDKLDISLRPSKSTVQTQLDVLRVSRVLQVGTKISKCSELESKIIEMDERILHFNANFVF